MSGQDSLSLTSVDSKQWLNYLEQICEVFRGEIPHVKHPKLDYAEFKQKQQIDSMEEFAKLRRFAVNRMQANAAAAGGGGTTQPAIMAAASATGIRKTSIYNEEERAKRSRKVLGAESSPSNIFCNLLCGRIVLLKQVFYSLNCSPSVARNVPVAVAPSSSSDC